MFWMEAAAERGQGIPRHIMPAFADVSAKGQIRYLLAEPTVAWCSNEGRSIS